MAVDYDVFVNVRRLDAQDTPTVQKLYKADDFDFRLKPASAAVDRGVRAADGDRRICTGSAPDLGALEVGQAPPHYGPAAKVVKFKVEGSSTPTSHFDFDLDFDSEYMIPVYCISSHV